jgi:UbiD family decarboxylase
MAFKDLREFLAALKQRGEVHEISAPVDKDEEIGVICSENSRVRGPALIFRNINGFRTPLVSGVLGTEQRFCLALNVAPQVPAVYEKWLAAVENPVPPKIVAAAPCQEIELDGVNLFSDPFPVPRWHARDGGPELGTFHSVITRGPDGSLNCGMYRNQIFDRETLGIYIASAERHIGRHWEGWREKNKPLPVAIAIGLDPCLTILSASPLPGTVTEYEVAGALMGEPYELVRAKTSDLLVPARAEIILEGEIPTDRFHPQEGPFGEFSGFMSPVQTRSRYIHIRKVTHRQGPLFQGTYEGKFFNESKVVRSWVRSVYTLKYLRDAGITGVRDVCVTPGSCAAFHTVVALRKSNPEQVRQVMSLVLNQPDMVCKLCIVVDEDVDPWDWQQVEWALSTRVQAGRDVLILKGRTTPMDPSQVPSKRGESDLLGIDATSPVEDYAREEAAMPALADPTCAQVEKIMSRWSELGLPMPAGEHRPCPGRKENP